MYCHTRTYKQLKIVIQNVNMQTTVHTRMNRATVLEPLAKSLGIEPKKWKNKQLLVDEIIRVQSLTREERCYNTQDPCTMEPLSNIDSKYYIEWNQHQHRFGADARSIRRMIETNNTILPWSIDFSTGIQASLDHDSYKSTFDMTQVPHFIDRVYAIAADAAPVSIEMEEMSTNNRFLFEMERILGNTYTYGVLLKKVIQNRSVRNIYKIISENMYRLLFQLRGDETMQLYFEVYYQYCYVYYTSQAFHILDKNAHLDFLLHTFVQFHALLGEPASNILQLLFIDM